MGDLAGDLTAAVGAEHVIPGDAPGAAASCRDEALSGTPQRPAFAVLPGRTAEVAELLRIASEHRTSVTARGMGTGVSGAAVPRPGEHGIGTTEKPFLLELEDPTTIALLGRIKAAFDPHGILDPGVALDPVDGA